MAFGLGYIEELGLNYFLLYIIYNINFIRINKVWTILYYMIGSLSKRTKIK
jgi:hypothetical protein